jgi:hypothetical protein
MNLIKQFGILKLNDEERSINLINNLFSESYDKVKAQHAKWNKMYSWYKGKQWSKKVASYRAQVVYNKIFSVIESMLPIMTDGQPRITVKAMDSKAKPFVSNVNMAINHLWSRLNVNSKQDWYVKDGLLYGDGFLKTGFDPDVKPFGEAFVSNLDSFYIYPDPNAIELKECEYIIFAKPESLNTIRNNYANGYKVESDDDFIKLFKNQREDVDDAKIQGPVNQAIIYESREEEGVDKNRNKQAVKMEIWMRDYPMEGDKLKYPFGRVITKAGNVVLDDKPNPYPYLVEKFGLYFPVVKWSSTILPHEFWNMGEVEQLIPVQQPINKAMSQVIEILAKMGNPQRIVPKNSGVDVDNLTNQPGLNIEVNAGTTISTLPAESPPPALFSEIEMLDTQMDTISGVHDLTQGRKPIGITSGKAMDVLQEASQTRLRKRIRQYEESLAELGRHLFEHIRNNYMGEREIEVPDVNNPGQKTFIPFDVKAIEGEFDFSVSVESSYLTSASSKLNKALAFFDRGAMDKRTLLEVGEWDNVDQILQRLAAAQPIVK